ncbi:MAG: STAS domain-containing protein [Sedimentisphaerales bacterium]|nr:STAS domain-containing protein [Sedimentisphaerales bacterium]
MGIKNISEDVLLVNLPPKEPQIGEELKHLNEIVITDSNFDVVIDFSGVEIINSSDISNLLTLRALLREHGRKLILSNVSVLTKGIFTVAGLDAVFEFAANRQDALAAVQHPKHTHAHTPSE